ncbi:TetR/AcrR family transcriptional regulator [Rossellomorea vietnamensis]|uniref:TetR/AcrR family transcriptional regulator n=1 Tax=Rossellomorea vietnamensis TaxID=218284 RepID=UPI001CCB8083|nr:TetR/AcrR family transcriptional regulator [Rossellomorea vietnamensis]MCA0151360.1 TetR/AcrR family transcriptional regulator [Rossellomorea vietnamensis]
MTDVNPLRADAQRNRERILAAAEDVFLERGAGASLDDIAKRAGVGIGTLYRRFPTRDSLLAATYSDRFLSFAQASRERSAQLDPASAVRAYLEELALHTSVFRGLAVLLENVLQESTPGCHATSEEGLRLLNHAQKVGVIRSDISFDDLVYVVTAISLAVEQDGSPKSRIAHLVGLFLDGICVR